MVQMKGFIHMVPDQSDLSSDSGPNNRHTGTRSMKKFRSQRVRYFLPIIIVVSDRILLLYSILYISRVVSRTTFYYRWCKWSWSCRNKIKVLELRRHV